MVANTRLASIPEYGIYRDVAESCSPGTTSGTVLGRKLNQFNNIIIFRKDVERHEPNFMYTFLCARPVAPVSLPPLLQLPPALLEAASSSVNSLADRSGEPSGASSNEGDCGQHNFG